MDGTSLVGSEEVIAERLAGYRAAGVTLLNVSPLAASPERRLADFESLRKLVD